MPNYVVSGAGTSAYNGTYEYYAADVYKKVGAPTIQIAYNGDGIWFFINGAVEGYVAGDVNGTPPLTGWYVGGNGTSPAPTLAEDTPTPAPTVTAISPSTGTTAGGTSVTITGTNLTGASEVTIGGTAATGVTVVSSTSITATTPAKTAGTASVLVTTAGGTNSANTLFTYTTPTPTPTPTPSPTSNTIRIKRSSTTTATPTSLLEGELAANITDKKIWIGDSTEAPILISDYNNAVGSGTVTSVGLTVPTGLSVANSPVTTAASLDITLTSGYSIPTTASQTNWDSAYTQRLQWDGGSTNLVAATGRTSLGATTIGSNLFTLPSPADIAFIRINLNNTVSTLSASTFRTAIGATTVGANMFTLTNPSAVTFPRFNLDNTVSALDAATFRTAIGAGTSSTSGTVTSIATTSPITGGTITGTGTIGINAASANTASYVVQRDASGNFSAGTITASLNGNATNVSGIVNLANGGTGQTTANAGLNALLPSQTSNSGKYLTSDGTNTSWGAVTGGPSFTASATAPVSPVAGDRWYDTNTGSYLIYLNDGTSSQWVETSNNPLRVSSLPVTLYSGSSVNVSLSNGTLPVLLFGGVTTVNVTVT